MKTGDAVSNLAVSSRRHGDGLVIMVDMNHNFVEDETTRRGDLLNFGSNLEKEQIINGQIHFIDRF